jgi:membrane protease YdiL (CAAX protease family)
LLEQLAAESGATVCRSYMFIFNELEVPAARSWGETAASVAMQSLLLPAGFVIAGYWAFARQLSLPSPNASPLPLRRQLALGIAVAAGAWITLKLLGHAIPGAGIDSGYTITAVGLPIAVSLVVFEPLMQELALRLWLVTLAERAIGTWPAVALSGLAVFPIHYTLDWKTTLPSALVGCALAALFVRTRSLWSCLAANSALGLALFLP